MLQWVVGPDPDPVQVGKMLEESAAWVAVAS